MLITERPARLRHLDMLEAQAKHPHQTKMKKASAVLFTAVALSTTAMATANASTYTVQSGDTLSKIATDKNVDLNQLIQANPGDANTLQVGQQVNVPDGNDTNTYTVKAGDTLGQIAENKGVTLADLEQWNQLTDSSVIQVGQVLQLSGNATTATTTTDTTQTQTSYTPQQTTDTTQTSGYTQPTTTTQPSSYTQTSTTTQQTSYTPQTSQSTTTPVQTNANPAASGDDGSSKAWIANRESGGSYTAQNGQYVGKYQLSASYLHGDYSAGNQEKTADQYVANRYGSWDNAKAFWQSHGWY